jgi:hypothetical protein
MKYHYIPVTNESEFEKIAQNADAYYAKQKERAKMCELVDKRNARLRELHDLRVKPRRTLDEDKKMAGLEIELRNMMLEIGRHGNHRN